MKRLSLAFILAICLQPCYANYDFIGNYTCQGYDPYLKKAYKGIIEIKQQNEVYKMKMDYDTGDALNATAGLFDPETISVVFQDPKNLKKVGLERYSVSKDGQSIEGYWVYLGKDLLGKEVCKKTP